MEKSLISFFKVLPTDPAYRDLNFFQKIILLSFIGEERVDQFDMIKSYMDYLKPYINPEMYKYEREYEDKHEKEQEKDREEERERTNMEFERQSKIGRATGRMQSSKVVRDAIAKMQAQIADSNRTWTITSDDPSTLG